MRNFVIVPLSAFFSLTPSHPSSSAKLLQARKKSHPSQAWLRQLPHKARKLEVRLYRSASSLEAYIDRSTLKSRLRRIAGNIIRQYSEVKKIRPSSKSRATSATSTASSLMSNFSRDSFASGASSTAHRDSVLSQSSTDSLRSLREAMLQKTSVTHAHLAAGDMRAQGQAQGEIQARSTLNPIAEGPSSHASMQHSMNIPFHTVSTFSGNDMMSSNNPDHSNTNDLERQKAVNAKLQQQIMENIRQQQEMTRRLQTVHRGSDLSMNSVGMNSRFQGSQNQRTAPFPVMPQTNMMQVGYTQGYNSMGFDGMNHQQMPSSYMNSQAAMTNSSMSSNQLRAHMAAQLSHNANIPNTLRAQMTAQLSRNQNLSAESIPIGGAFPTSSINSFPGSQMGMMGGAKSMVPNSSMPFSVMQGHQQVRPISSPLDMNSNHAPFQHSGEMPGPNSNTQKPNERDSQDGNNLSKEAYPW